MPNLKRIALVFILLFSPLNSFGIEENFEKVDLLKAIEIAEAENLDIQLSKFAIQISKNDIKKANRLQNPELGIFWNFGKAGEGNPQQIGLGETIELFKRHGRKKLMKAYLDFTSVDSEFKRFDVKMDIREAYVNLAYKKSILDVQKNQKELFEKSLKIAEEKFKKDDSFKTDVIQTKIALNKIEFELDSAEKDAKIALIDFNKAMNVENKKFDITDDNLFDRADILDIDTPDIDDNAIYIDLIIKNAVQSTFEVKLAKAKIEIEKQKLSNVKSQRIPDIGIKSGYSFQGKNTSDNGKFQSGAFIEAELLNLPVLYSYKPEIDNQELGIKNATVEYNSIVNKKIKNIERAYEKFEASKLNLVHYNKKIIQDSKELLNLSQKSYEDGKLELTSLIEIQQDYQDIMLEYANAMAQYYLEWIEFLRAVNSETLDRNLL